MKALFTIALALMLALVVPGATPLSCAEDESDGWVEDGVYTNRVYSFKVEIPTGWQVASDDARTVYSNELNKGGKSDARALLILFRPAQAPTEVPDMLVVAGAKTGVAVGVSREAAMAYLKAQKRPKSTEIIRPASQFLFGGLLVAREDVHSKADNGRDQYMANMLVAVRDRLLSFQAYSPTPAGLERDVDALAAVTEFQPDWVARPTNSASSDPPAQERVRISQASLMSLVEKQVRPELPDSLSETPVTATIDMHVLVTSDGAVEKVWVFEGPPQLAWPAVQAVSKWKFRPYLVNGKPVPVESTVTVGFQ